MLPDQIRSDGSLTLNRSPGVYLDPTQVW